MHRPNFAMRLMAAMTALVAGSRAYGDDGLRAGVKTRTHGPAPAFEGYGGRALSWSPRVAFTARSGRTIVRETIPGSDHERRLLRRRNARKVGY